MRKVYVLAILIAAGPVALMRDWEWAVCVARCNAWKVGKAPGVSAKLAEICRWAKHVRQIF